MLPLAMEMSGTLLRTFAWKFSNIDFFFSETFTAVRWWVSYVKNVKKDEGSLTSFWREHARTGAIIGNGDRKRAPFLVLGLSPWYGTSFLFLEQIAPSPAAHARTCWRDFCGCRAGGMASEIPKIFHVFDPQLNAFTSVGILLKYFPTDDSFTWAVHYSTLNFTYDED